MSLNIQKPNKTFDNKQRRRKKHSSTINILKGIEKAKKNKCKIIYWRVVFLPIFRVFFCLNFIIETLQL